LLLFYFVVLSVFVGRRVERKIIVLVDCFMCMVVLVLRIPYGQVVLLWTVLNFVAWQLEKASKCSAVDYTLSLVI
jgi:hypothetical protein